MGMAGEASDEGQLWASRSQFENIFTLVAVGDLEGVSEAIGKDEEKLNATEEEDGAKPLHWAVRHNREDMVKSLMELGADVEVSDKDGETPLLHACRDGRASMTIGQTSCGDIWSQHDRHWPGWADQPT